MDIINMMKAKQPAKKDTKDEKVAVNSQSPTEKHSETSLAAENAENSGVKPEISAPQWKIHGSHMVTRLPSVSAFKNYFSESESPKKTLVRVAAFDMDDTLITTKSGIKFGRGPHDWKWRTPETLEVLEKKVKQEKMVFVIFTNQAAVSVTEKRAAASKSYKNLTVKIGHMASSLETRFGPIPVLFFASTGKPRKSVFPRSSDELHFSHRKPEAGMWAELEKYIRRCLGSQCAIDLEHSYFVGDAAGRDGDHSAADKGFAENAGVPFCVPEDYFGA